MAEAHGGDTGTILRWTVTDGTVPVNVASATTRQVKLIKPDGSMLVGTLMPSTLPADTGDYSDGRVEYVTQAGELVPGTYTWFLYFAGLSGWSGHSQSGRFRVAWAPSA